MGFYEDENDFLIDYDDYVNAWVDGSCFRNGMPGARAGYGVFYNWDHHLNRSAPVKGRATNNAGEIQAAICAIRDLSNYGYDNVQINTDSMFLYRAYYDWLDRWAQNDFYKMNGDPLANRRDFINLYRLRNQNSHMHIVLEYVPAHCGDKYNDAADELAKDGANMYRY